jgi:hypothetical protein
MSTKIPEGYQTVMPYLIVKMRPPLLSLHRKFLMPTFGQEYEVGDEPA